MTPSRLLFELQRAGFRLSVDGGKLNVDGPIDRLDELQKALIREHRERLVQYCTPSATAEISRALAKLDLAMEDRRDFLYRFNERAGIREFDGGMSRSDAERLASDDILTEICQLDQQPSNIPPAIGDCLPAGACSGAKGCQNTPDTPERARIDARPPAGDSGLFEGGSAYGLPDTGRKGAA